MVIGDSSFQNVWVFKETFVCQNQISTSCICWLKTCKGWYTYGIHENCPIFKTPHPPCPSTSEIPPPSWPWMFNFKRPSLLSKWYSACERTNIKRKTKPSQVTFKLIMLSFLRFRPTNNVMVSLKDGFTVWCQKKVLSDIAVSYFSVQVKSGACYFTGQWGRVQNEVKENQP